MSKLPNAVSQAKIWQKLAAVTLRKVSQKISKIDIFENNSKIFIFFDHVINANQIQNQLCFSQNMKSISLFYHKLQEKYNGTAHKQAEKNLKLDVSQKTLSFWKILKNLRFDLQNQVE